MKHLTILFIAAVLVATSCSKSNQELLVGTWTASGLKVTSKSTTTNQDTVYDITPLLMFSPTSFTFNACASTCTGSMTRGGMTNSFTYVLSDDGKTITATDSTSVKNVIAISELTSTSLKVKANIPVGQFIFNPSVPATADIELTKK